MNGCLTFLHLRLARCVFGAMLFAICLAFAVSNSLQARPSVAQPRNDDSNIATVREILELPDPEIDLVKAKLTIDRLIDSSLDIAEGLRQLDEMTTSLRTMFPTMASNSIKLEMH